MPSGWITAPMVHELPSSSLSNGLPRSKPEIPWKSDWFSVNTPPLAAILALTPGAARQATEAGSVEVAVTPTQGSWTPVGNVWLGGEYSSLMFGARVDNARIARKRNDGIGAHSRPPFQLNVLPTVE